MPSQEYLVDAKELTLGRELGRGGFGVVHQATYNYTDVAVKKLFSDLSPESTQEFEREAETMSRLRFPNIIQFLGYTLSPERSIVMEYMPNGSLYHLLHSNQPIEWTVRIQIATDISKGLAFLHQKNILHRDIKSLNVLLGKSYEAKLTDFGLSKVKIESRSKSTAQKTLADSVGTLQWMAPELFISQHVEFKTTADVYSLGMTLFEIANREVPFSKAINPQMVPMWAMQGERPDIAKDVPENFAEMISQSWDTQPENRPAIGTIIERL